jgi:hypothetical protein
MAENLKSPPRNDAVPYIPGWLNALSDAEKQSVAMSDFSRSMHNSGGEHVAWLLWSTQERVKPTPLEYRQGSMFFLDCGCGPFAVTVGLSLHRRASGLEPALHPEAGDGFW